MTTADSILEVTSLEQDSQKRQQILDGARKVFLEHGFDGASMNDIVKAAGVSKGTIYAYFPSKEKLFEKLVSMDKRQQVERNCSRYFQDSRPVKDVLLDAARDFPCRIISSTSIAYVRLVMAASGKFPEIG